MSLISIASLDIWQKTIMRYLDALEIALNKLQNERTLPDQEIDLNRKLFAYLLISIAEIDPYGAVFASLPVTETCNQPDFDDLVRTSREDKRPDIQWGYRDLSAPPLQSQKMFVIECKRLGSATDSGWQLNKNYVVNGICRFKNEGHGYAKAHPSGAMIGYVQSMEMRAILKEVNVYISDEGLSEITLPEQGWKLKGVTHLFHEFDRAFQVTPFKLFHRWVDIRTD